MAASKLEYLKRYMSKDDDDGALPKKKKKKKKQEKDPGRQATMFQYWISLSAIKLRDFV